ncbi:hypothetical protein BHE74_00029337 [Ensete ventricosum]|nr:hypothetical protein BHE74_00029337 [Ensete ventricosum]
MVVKSLNKERMKENMEIFDWELSEEDRVKISQIPQCKMISTYSLLSPQESRDSIDLLDVDISEINVSYPLSSSPVTPKGYSKAMAQDTVAGILSALHCLDSMHARASMVRMIGLGTSAACGNACKLGKCFLQYFVELMRPQVLADM